MGRLSSPSHVIFTVVFAAATLLFGRGIDGAELKPETVKAWAEYVRLTEARIGAELDSTPKFLVLDFLPPADGVNKRILPHRAPREIPPSRSRENVQQKRGHPNRSAG